MSELINTNSHNDIRLQLLMTVSALSLIAAAGSPAKAEDADRPTVWIEVGGQADATQGISEPFTAPFMSVEPTPKIYEGAPFIEGQRLSRFAFGSEGKIALQPENSNWVFSVGARYGRSNNNKQLQQQSFIKVPTSFVATYARFPTARNANYTNTTAHNRESHLFMDFQAGKDVGVGLLGRDSESVFSFGVRFAQLNASSDVTVRARPDVYFKSIAHHGLKYWENYVLVGEAERSFHGIGPSLSWKSSVPIIGDANQSEILLDFGVTGSVLFGRQTAKGSHYTTGYKFGQKYNNQAHGPNVNKNYKTLYLHHGGNFSRSRSVTVPDLGGFAGISFRYSDAKISFGYRGELLFGAMDSGIDAVNRTNTSFHGPYATISVGLGG